MVTHRAKTTSQMCEPDEIAALVTRFLSAVTRGNRDELAHFFDDGFQVYSMGEYDTEQAHLIRHVAYVATESGMLAGTVRGPRHEVIGQLLDYFVERHKQHEQMQLLEIASVGGGGDIAFVIRRQADDLDPEIWGPDLIVIGKGFVDCENQAIDAWGAAMNTPSPSSIINHVCPTPTADWSQDTTTLACE